MGNYLGLSMQPVPGKEAYFEDNPDYWTQKQEVANWGVSTCAISDSLSLLTPSIREERNKKVSEGK